MNDSIVISELVRKLLSRKKRFLILWCVTFVLSCIWIFPQPRYYTCTVKLAPEIGDLAGGYASIASSFGINIGGGAGTDAISPTLYPELFDSPEFLVGLFGVTIETDDGTYRESYYDYLTKHQKQNWLTRPFRKARKYVTSLFEDKIPEPSAAGARKDPFKLSVRDARLLGLIKSKIMCGTDTRTSVVTITVKDQDRQVCALMADSIREHLQSFIIDYRTKKYRQDLAYFSHVSDSARVEYERKQAEYAAFSDSHRGVTSPVFEARGDKLRNEMELQLNAYNTVRAQYEMARAKLQERTPAFTTLVGATVPVQPAGPRRMMFVALMLVLATMVYAGVVLKSDLRKMVLFYNRI